MKNEHVRDEPLKDAAQDVAEDVPGAAEDGGAKVLIVARAIFHCPPRFPWATPEGQAGQGRGAGRCGGRATGRGAGTGLRGPGAARLPRLATTAAAAAVFVQLTLR